MTAPADPAVELARRLECEAGANLFNPAAALEIIRAALAAVRAEEREACLRIVESYIDDLSDYLAPGRIADEIRHRNDDPAAMEDRRGG